MSGDEVWNYDQKGENQRKNYEKIFRRIGKFKKYTNDMCNIISNHAVKLAGLRDRNDEIAQCLDEFTKIEEFSTTSKLSMAVAAELVATVGDHQDLAVQRVETLVLPNLSSYARICDCIKADVWNAIQAIRREKKKKKTVKQIKKKTFNDDPKSKAAYDNAQRELERASAETGRLCQLSEEQVLKFEHKRLIDLKESLSMFVKIQIATCAKSLELLSETYKQIHNIDEDGDLNILKTSLKIGRVTTSRSKTASTVQSQRSLRNSEKESSKQCSQKTSIILNGKEDSVKKRKGKNVCESSCSEDSSDSEGVRRLEKVLQSSSSSIKRKEKAKDNSSSNAKVDSRKSSSPKRDKSAKRSPSDTTKSRESDLVQQEKLRTNSLLRHKFKTKEKEKDGEKTCTQSSKGVHKEKSAKDKISEDEDYPLQLKLIGKRPSTPTRPVTVPMNTKSSTEELSSRQDELSFNDYIKSKRQSSLERDNPYYYSQSEDDKRTFRPVTVTAAKDQVKRVSFLSPDKEVRLMSPGNSTGRNVPAGKFAKLRVDDGGGDGESNRNLWNKQSNVSRPCLNHYC